MFFIHMNDIPGFARLGRENRGEVATLSLIIRYNVTMNIFNS
jgi:hypothetical protein